MFQRILRFNITFIFAIVIAVGAYSADPSATNYTFDQCRGSYMPYVAPQNPELYPDSLKPIFISHIGRHGARYPASSKNIKIIKNHLLKADSLGCITSSGKQLLQLCKTIETESKGRWGALDSIGEAEQRGIASRMYGAYPELFNGKNISAISSYSPRCIMSMYTFLHMLSRLDNHINISCYSGRDYSYLLRFFDDDEAYNDYKKADSWRNIYNNMLDNIDATQILSRVLGAEFPYHSINIQEAAMAEYANVIYTAAMGIESNPSDYFSNEQINSLWQCFNLRQYLLHSASTLSSEPAEIASQLLLNIVNEADKTISDIENGRSFNSVQLRFGHAETLMPLLSLMRINGCYYLTNYFDTVAKNWCDFKIAPMAANLQFIFFQGPKERIYVKIMLNEHPVTFIKGSDCEYQIWEEVRSHLMRCVPLYYQ